MKITKKGRVKLERGDIQVGNFIIHTEKNHFKVQDINEVFSLRVAGMIPVGQMIKACVANIEGGDNNCEKFIHDYASVMYNVLCAAPDVDFLKDVNEAAVGCVNRHKEMYGIKEDITFEEDNEIVKEEQALAEAMEEVKKEEGIKE